MKNIQTLLPLGLLCLVLGFTACQKDDDRIPGSGNITTARYELGDFTRVCNKGTFNIFVHPATSDYVEVEADDNLQDRIRLKNKDGELQLETTENDYAPTRFFVHIHLRNLESLHQDGTGFIIANDTLRGTDLEYKHTGTGTTKLTTAYTSIDGDFSGVGNVSWIGTTTNFSLDYKGTGNFFAFDLACENIDMDHNGTGNFELTVTRKFTLKHRGSGNVVYRGNPSIKDFKYRTSSSIRPE